MKTRQILALASAFLISVAGLTSCNKENEGKDADEVFGKFEITDTSSPIQSIELTGNGEYIVTQNPARTKGDDDDLELNDVWVYGSFTFVDGFYFLQGFGKIAIDMLSGGAAEVFIDRSGWDPFTVDAKLASTVEKTTINRSLCRHWVFERTSFSVSFSDLPFLDDLLDDLNFDVDGCNFSKWFQITGDEEGDELEEECTGIIFTESGTYAVLFDNGKVNVGTWDWENSKDGSLKCDWSNQYKSLFKDYRFHGALTVNVEEGDPATCTIVRSFDSTMKRYKIFSGYSSHSITTALTYHLKEFK